jgi:hypothetical protein
MTQEEEIAHLKKRLSELVERFSEVVEHLSKAEARESHLLAQLSAMQADNQALHEQVAAAQKHIEELEKQKMPPPPFVKVNVLKPQAEAKQERKKRDFLKSLFFPKSIVYFIWVFFLSALHNISTCWTGIRSPCGESYLLSLCAERLLSPGLEISLHILNRLMRPAQAIANAPNVRGCARWSYATMSSGFRLMTKAKHAPHRPSDDGRGVKRAFGVVGGESR